MKATVLVRPKEGILDPQGQAVEEARVGRVIDLELGDGTGDADDREHARVELERMCEQLLANPLIESFEIVLDE